MNKYLKILIIFFLFVLLALVRFFETEIFYDPFTEFFKADYLYLDQPVFQKHKLLLHLTFRFWLNSGISLLILYVAFFDKNVMKFSTFLYSLLFLILFGAFWWILNDLQQENYLVLFYVRRFLIQPLLILILLPAFYYQKIKKQQN
ncbi:MAG TPA: exosortase F system-associated protein [Salinimicrobium sp.]|nr:exosortase F system-associated protein [Salinimicrobium sp.]